MTFEEKFWLLIIGGLIAIITAFVTNFLNRRWLVDEVAQNQIIEAQVEIYRKLGRDVARLTNDVLQLLAYLAFESRKMIAEGKSNDEMLLEINKEFAPKSSELLERVFILKEEYIFLPTEVIASIKKLQEVTWQAFKNATPETLSNSYKILDAADKLLCQIRLITSQIMSRQKKVSSLIKDIPEEGFATRMEREAVQGLRNTKKNSS